MYIHFYVWATCLELQSWDQRAEEGSISIKLQTPPSQLKNRKMTQYLWSLPRQYFSAFSRTDGQTDADGQERKREGGAEAGMEENNLWFLRRKRNICDVL